MKSVAFAISLLAGTGLSTVISKQAWLMQTIEDFDSLNHVAAFEGIDDNK